MRKFILISGLFFLYNLSAGQTVFIKDTASRQVLKEQVRKLSLALLKSDTITFISYMHPAVVAMLGSRQKAITYIGEMWSKSQKEGTSFADITTGEPSAIIVTKDEWQCTIPETMKMKSSKGFLMIIKTTLIAVSFDKGRRWYFIDTFRKSRDVLKAVFPTLSEELVIPPASEPQTIKD
jgi:serine kinase of HPr protein (carbohydrate metabolism regulator)